MVNHCNRHQRIIYVTNELMDNFYVLSGILMKDFLFTYLVNLIQNGSDYRYTCPDAIQIKASVCHLNCVDLVASRLCITATMPMVFGLTLTLPTSVFFFFIFFRLLGVTFRG